MTLFLLKFLSSVRSDSVEFQHSRAFHGMAAARTLKNLLVPEEAL
jgi:hypothetical protein